MVNDADVRRPSEAVAAARRSAGYEAIGSGHSDVGCGAIHEVDPAPCRGKSNRGQITGTDRVDIVDVRVLDEEIGVVHRGIAVAFDASGFGAAKVGSARPEGIGAVEHVVHAHLVDDHIGRDKETDAVGVVDSADHVGNDAITHRDVAAGVSHVRPDIMGHDKAAGVAAAAAGEKDLGRRDVVGSAVEHPCAGDSSAADHGTGRRIGARIAGQSLQGHGGRRGVSAAAIGQGDAGHIRPHRTAGGRENHAEGGVAERVVRPFLPGADMRDAGVFDRHVDRAQSPVDPLRRATVVGYASHRAGVDMAMRGPEHGDTGDVFVVAESGDRIDREVGADRAGGFGGEETEHRVVCLQHGRAESIDTADRSVDLGKIAASESGHTGDEG